MSISVAVIAGPERALAPDSRGSRTPINTDGMWWMGGASAGMATMELHRRGWEDAGDMLYVSLKDAYHSFVH